MNRQLYQVLRTYFQRPLLLVIGACAVMPAVGLFFVGLYAETGGSSIAPDFPSLSNSAFVSSNDLTDELAGRQPSTIDRLHVSDPYGEPPVNLTPFDHVTTVQLFSPKLTMERIAQLKSLAQLRNMAIKAPNIPAGTWSVLGPKLQQLELPARLLLEHPQEVSQLQRLEILRIERSALNRETMSVISQIPNLKCLVLSHRVVDTNAPADFPPSEPLVWDPAQLEPLQNHPHLQAIFIDWPNPAHRTTPVLPGVVLYAASGSYSQQRALQLCFAFAGALSILVALQTWAHFSSQQSVIIPGHHRPHLQASLLVLAMGSITATLLLRLAQISLLPALVMTLMVPSLLMAIMVGTQSRSQMVRTGCTLLPLFFSGLICWLSSISLSASPTIAGEITWFLQGETWWWAMGALAVEGVLLTTSFYHLPGIAHQVYERSSMPPGFSPWDPQQQRRTAYGSQQWWQSLWNRNRQFPKLAGSPVWRQARLWRMGNAYRPLVMFLVMGAVYLAMVITMPISIGQSQFRSSLLIGCLYQFGAITLFLPINVWYRRCRSLQVESLRPAGRNDLIRQLFVALALDQVWAIIPAFLWIGHLLIFPQQGGSEVTAVAIAPLLVAALVWGYAISTSVFAIRRVWVLVGYFLAMLIAPAALGISVATLLHFVGIPISQQVSLWYIAALAALAIAVGIVRTTFVRALKREWGWQS